MPKKMMQKMKKGMRKVKVPKGLKEAIARGPIAPMSQFQKDEIKAKRKQKR